jgi:hypothetical protein
MLQRFRVGAKARPIPLDASGITLRAARPVRIALTGR